MRINSSLGILVGLFLTVTAAEESARAFILPYNTRTKDFSGWAPDTRGDINTIGMAGATVAVPDSVSAAKANPAGFAMLTGSVSAQYNKMTFDDPRIQRNDQSIDATEWGFAVTPKPWAFSLAYYSPVTESGIYVSPNTHDTVNTEVSIKELRFSLGRNFDDIVSVGATFEINKAVRVLDDVNDNAFGVSYGLGALARLPQQFLVGVNFAPQISVGPAGTSDPQTIIPGFNRTVVEPLQASFGLGWIPGRYLKAGLSFTFVGSTPNTALLADQSVQTGGKPTWVPRLGGSYIFYEVPNLKIIASAGSYFEVSRVSDQSNRLHATGGLEANPYFVNLGFGLDMSAGYQNILVSVGIDIVRTLRAFDIIPKDTTPSFHGLWPPIVMDPSESQTKVDTVSEVGKIIEQVPANIEKKVAGQPTTVEVKEKTEKRTGKPAPKMSPAATDQ